MIKPGLSIRVRCPVYAIGLEGVVEAKESRHNLRWIVKIKNHSLKANQKPLLLSLDESDFEVLKMSESKKA